MMLVPDNNPLTNPVDPTLAADELLLHAPPAVTSDKLTVEPTHTVVEPFITPGIAFTVTFNIVKQPVGRVYEIIAVPAAKPVTSPEASTFACRLLPPQVPPVAVSPRLNVDPAHIGALPVMPAGKLLIVRTAVVRQPLGNV